MNATFGMDEPNQRPSSGFSSVKGGSLKHGIRGVISANRISGGLGSSKDEMTAAIGIASKDQHPQPLEGDSTEISVEDLATIPRVVGDVGEASMILTDSASSLRTSIHKKYGAKGAGPLFVQNSPRGPEDWGAGSGNTATTARSSSHGPSFAGSDPIYSSFGTQSAHVYNNSSPASPVAASSPLKHPKSAPQALQTSGLSPKEASHHGKKGLLRAIIKVSALKNVVGKGLDLSSSHRVGVPRSDPNNKTSRGGLAAEEAGIDHSRRQATDDMDDDDDDFEDEDFASPQQAKGMTGKMKSRVKMSIDGFKTLAGMKGKSAAAMLLEDNHTESTDEIDRPPPSEVLVQPPSQEITVDEAQSVKESKFQDMLEAKIRRREKHNQRNAKRVDESSHSDSFAADKEDTPKSPRPRSQRSGGRGPLNPEAKERLRKHSESNGLRNRSNASRLRRGVLASTKQDSGRLAKDTDTAKGKEEPLPAGSSHSQSKHGEVSPKPVKGSVATLLRAPSGEGAAPTQQAKKKEEAGGGESQRSGRKLKKEEDEELRVRVRRGSLLANAKEPSFTVGHMMEDEDDASLAEELAESVAPAAGKKEDTSKKPSATLPESGPQEGSLDGLFLSSNSRLGNSSGYLAGGSSNMGGSSSSVGLHVSSSASLGVSSASAQGSFQRVESIRTDGYLQLVGVPLKDGSPQKPGDTTAEAKKMTRRSSKPKLMDSSMDATESRRKSSRKQGEKKEGSRRGLDKKEGRGRRIKAEGGGKTGGHNPRIDKSNRHRANSPHRHSEEGNNRRRKAAPRPEGGHASMPAISSVDHEKEEGSATNLDMVAAGESNGTLGTSSSNILVSSNLDASSKSNIQDNVETEEQEKNEEARLENKKGVKRQPTKERRKKASKHSASAKQRPSRSQGTKKDPSMKGRSDARQESKRTQGNNAPRRHSLEAKKNISAASVQDDMTKLNSDLEKSLAKIQW